MTDKRLAEIIDDICHLRPVKMTNEEGKQISWRYLRMPLHSKTVIINVRNNNGNKIK